ncbi:hypothetical protein [Pseudoruegeria aquimaris]|uniref:hypothetical protein n=1 Tax=Pseudoruegeria aquimaris TaxID=393663 RepID=UPI00111C64B8|nr:hypothetical protein [Pseudoruegeria aquimaris]
MSRFVVVADWKALYEHPVTLDEGDEVWMSGKSDAWNGHTWIRARDRAGREGWIPETLPKRIGGRTYATASFSAQELTCQPGETLDGIEATHGWILCRNAKGSLGWVPSANLRKADNTGVG